MGRCWWLHDRRPGTSARVQMLMLRHRHPIVMRGVNVTPAEFLGVARTARCSRIHLSNDISIPLRYRCVRRTRRCRGCPAAPQLMSGRPSATTPADAMDGGPHRDQPDVLTIERFNAAHGDLAEVRHGGPTTWAPLGGRGPRSLSPSGDCCRPTTVALGQVFFGYHSLAPMRPPTTPEALSSTGRAAHGPDL